MFLFKKGFYSRLLLILVLSIFAFIAVYEADFAQEPKFFILGMIVSTNITAILFLRSVGMVLFRIQELVAQWLLGIGQNYFIRNGRLGPVLCRGSTNTEVLDSSGLLFVEKLSLKVRNFHDKVKSNSNNIYSGTPHITILLHKSDPVRSELHTNIALIYVSNEHEQQNWLRCVSNEEIINALSHIFDSISSRDQIRRQPFVKFALNELSKRLRDTWQQHPLLDTGFHDVVNQINKPIVRYAA